MKNVDDVLVTQPTAVIADFLGEMSAACERTFPVWRERLIDGLIDVAPASSPLYDQFINHQPLEDFYFAGVVAYEASTIRRHLDADTASELLSELAAQVDRAAGRTDRVVSDLVFFIIGRLELESGLDVLTMPYDKTVQIMLQRIGLDRDEKTQPLMTDFAFRHGLGEPLARGIPAWWKKYAKLARIRAEAARQSGHVAVAAE